MFLRVALVLRGSIARCTNDGKEVPSPADTNNWSSSMMTLDVMFQVLPSVQVEQIFEISHATSFT